MAGTSFGGWGELREHLRSEARREGIPLFGTFELTPLCNFRCKMCYVRLDPGRMRELGRLRTTAEWLDLARQAQDAGMMWLTLTGGEIITRPDFPELYRELHDRGLYLTLLTNGSLLDDGALSLLRERPPSFVRVTLYGASNETYERLCGVRGGFDAVMRNLRALRDADLRFSLSFTQTVENVGDVERVREVARELGVPLQEATSLAPAVRGARSDVDRMRVPVSERLDVLRARREGRPIARRAVPASASFEPGAEAFWRCAMYRCGFWVDWNGFLEPCGFMSSVRARPFQDGFDAAWQRLLDRAGRIALPEACRTCTVRESCFSCPGLLEAETGSPERVCERICQEASRWSALSKV